MSTNTLEDLVSKGHKLTPMMEQYYQIKKSYQDTLLLFRMGDFYEVFFDDAKKTSQYLNITLTHRGKIGETPIPMAGIPHHAANAYIDRLTNRGLKVAICEQVQDPKDAVGIVKRAVTQVVSPGMPFDLEKTQGNEQRYIAAGFQHEQIFHLVTIDFTTGEFFGKTLNNVESFLEEIRLVQPKEFITFMGQWNELSDIEKLLESMGTLTTYLSEDFFHAKNTDLYIEKLIPGFKRDRIIQTENAITNPLGALSYYITSTQKIEVFHHVKPFKIINSQGHLKITLPTLVGLEILPKSKETYKDSLLGFFDKTETAMGARYLKHLFTNPLKDIEEINKRLNLTESLIKQYDDFKIIKEELSKVRDLERILAKISVSKATSSDLLNLSVAIKSYENVLLCLSKESKKEIDQLPKDQLNKLKNLAKEITDTLNDEIGASLDKGNLIKTGVNKERDRLFNLHQNVAEELLVMENQLREKTGILKLKIKSNNVSGFFIEVPKGATTKTPNYFERRQTLVNAERYTTKELTELEKETITAKEKLERLEREIFKGLINEVTVQKESIHSLSHLIAKIDAFQSFATIAVHEDLTKPKIDENKQILNLKSAFHPLIRSFIKDQFVSHDIFLDQNVSFGLITGPNMAGKTTVMREVAIVQLLAQIGSFVPAKFAEIGVVDFLFSRLGASDDILKGQSTFMVEMAETAEILRHATHKSLIILDEVGRGTSTYDGLSIAWALVEHFIEKTRALTLFATHYHELIDVIDQRTNAKNLTVETVNHKGNVQFLYRLIEKGASQSYGIYVAKLAGLPPSILKRSEEILKRLELDSLKIQQASQDQSQLSFLNSNAVNDIEIPEHLTQIESELNKIDISRLTPLDALLKLNELKSKLELH